MSHAHGGLDRHAATPLPLVDGDRNRLVDAAAQALCIATEDAQERLQAVLDRSSR